VCDSWLGFQIAVIKGYHDLLLTGSLGHLSEKQKNILEESKDSCERLVRLVSMFLSYSAMESGKLALQLRTIGSVRITYSRYVLKAPRRAGYRVPLAVTLIDLLSLAYLKKTPFRSRPRSEKMFTEVVPGSET
jgi:signal transduction histidine kinase